LTHGKRFCGTHARGPLLGAPRLGSQLGNEHKKERWPRRQGHRSEFGSKLAMVFGARERLRLVRGDAAIAGMAEIGYL